MVRIAPQTHAVLRKIAGAKKISLTEALDRAIEVYRREIFLEGVAADFAALRKDRKAWRAEQAERREWDTTLADTARD